MEKITTIGLDIARHVFQVQGINGAGSIVSRRKLRRDDVVELFRALPPCLIGIGACATGHHWARVLMALGHEVRLMPASYVKPYVKRQRNDATDAEGIRTHRRRVSPSSSIPARSWAMRCGSHEVMPITR